MRKSWEIEKEIEEIEAKIERLRQQINRVKDYLDQLRNLRCKAAHREELERDGVEINIVSVERIPGYLGGWEATTDEGLKYSPQRKPKLGRKRVTRRFYELMVECKKEAE